MAKYSNPKRYMPDYRMSISHELVYMKEVNEQGYIDGELYDELYAEYCQLTLITILALLFLFIGWVIL